MRGTDFPEATMKLLPPEGHEEDVYPLHIWRHPEGGMVISKWRMTWRERLSCLWNGYVWFHCWGNTHPPIAIETAYPFEKPKGKGTFQLILALTAFFCSLAIFIYFAWRIVQ
jgi:hypothetical protein